MPNSDRWLKTGAARDFFKRCDMLPFVAIQPAMLLFMPESFDISGRSG